MRVEIKSQDDLTPAQQLERVTEFANALMDDQQKTLTNLLADLRNAGIFVHESMSLRPNRKWLEVFLDQVLPVLTPLAIDPAHPFPFIPNLGFALALQLSRADDDNRMNALLLIPQQLDRFILLPKSKTAPNCILCGLRHWCRCSSSAHSRDIMCWGRGVPYHSRQRY